MSAQNQNWNLSNNQFAFMAKVMAHAEWVSLLKMYGLEEMNKRLEFFWDKSQKENLSMETTIEKFFDLRFLQANIGFAIKEKYAQ